MRIQFASCCNCTFVATLFYNVSWTFFFFILDSLSAFVRREIKSLTFHGTIMTFQLFQLMLRGLSFTVFATPAAPPANEPRISNNDRIDTTAFCCYRKYRFTFFFFFKSMPIFVLTFIAAQTVAAALSL